jgi:hypothetical protein
MTSYSETETAIGYAKPLDLENRVSRLEKTERRRFFFLISLFVACILQSSAIAFFTWKYIIGPLGH